MAVMKETMSITDSKSFLAQHQVVLITGAAGFFGFHIASRFLRAGKHVVAVDKINAETTTAQEKEDNLKKLLALADQIPEAEISIYRQDILENEGIREIIKQTVPTACVHAASLVDDRRSVKHPTDYLTVNIIGTQKLLQTIVDCGTIKQFVYISTRSTFGQVTSPEHLMQEEAPKRPINPYGASKVGAEAICHVYHHIYGLHVNIIRIFALYGPGGRPDMIPRQLIEKIYSGKTIQKFGSGEANRDWMYIEDATEAVFLAANQPRGYQVFNVGTGKGTSLNELISVAEEVVGKRAIIENLPVPLGDAHFVGVADNSKARELLGWNPKVSLRKGMAQTLVHYLKEIGDGENMVVLKKYNKNGNTCSHNQNATAETSPKISDMDSKQVLYRSR